VILRFPLQYQVDGLHQDETFTMDRPTLDRIVTPLLNARKGIGLAIGVIERGQSSTYQYGALSHTRREPIEDNTLFEIGSVNKVFTATLLACAVAEGVVDLNHRVCELVPGVNHPSPCMTLLQLATHTSGLPRLPFGFYLSMLKNPRNPYANYTQDDLLAYLSKHKSKRRPQSAQDATFRYSNFGFGLLGYILAQRLEMAYEDAVVHRICDPLDMSDTRITLTAEQAERLAIPHTPSGRPTLNWDFSALAGAGAIRSTLRDMLKFVNAQLGQAPLSLEKAMSACHTMYIDLPPLPRRGIRFWIKRCFGRSIGHIEPAFGMGLGWHLSRFGGSGNTIYWHNGATGGYRAFAGFIKESKTGIVVLSNRGLSMYDMLFRARTVEEIGFNVLQCLHQEPDQSRV
jgi:CubicO group peptidase (beta-lactamase class C family)